MNNNPMQLFAMFSQAQNPMLMMTQMMGNNPLFQQAMKMASGKNPTEIKEIVSNIASQKGITQEQLQNMANMMNLRF